MDSRVTTLQSASSCFLPEYPHTGKPPALPPGVWTRIAQYLQGTPKDLANWFRTSHHTYTTLRRDFFLTELAWCVEKIATRHPRLETALKCVPSGPGVDVILRECFTQYPYSWVTDTSLDIISAKEGITELDFSQHTLISVTNAGLEALAKRCKALKALRIPLPSERITDDGIITLLKGCTALTTLSIAQSLPYGISTASIRAITERGGWKALGIRLPFAVDDHNLAALAKSSPELEELDVCRCEQVTDAGLTVTAECCKKLRKLNIGQTNITDAGLCSIATHSTELEDLDIGLCSISDAGLKTLAEHSKKLTTCTLFRSHHITEKGLITFVTDCITLKELILTSFCITETGCTAIVEQGKGLEKLGLRDCGITDARCIAIAKYGTELQALDLSDCQEITDVGLEAITKNCTHLTTLHIKRCHRVTEQAIATAKKNNKMLHITQYYE